MQYQSKGDRRGAVPPEKRRGAPPLSLVVGGCVGGELVYLKCPVCGRRIEQPFDSEGRPQAVIHVHSRRRNARLIVHPAEGTVRQIPDHVSLEVALRDEIRSVG